MRFHRRSIIETNTPAYGGATLCNLLHAYSRSKNGVRTEGYYYTGIPVGVNKTTACARKRCEIVDAHSQSSAFGTGFAGVCWVYFDNRDSASSTDFFKRRLEESIRHSLYLTIFCFGRKFAVYQPVKVFKRDNAVVLDSQVYDLVSNLVRPGLSEVGFFADKLLKVSNGFTATRVGMFPQFASPDADISLPVPDVSAEVKLPEWLQRLSIDYGNSGKGSRPRVDAKDILFSWVDFGIFLLRVDDKEQSASGISSNPEIRVSVSLGDNALESLPAAIAYDWDSQALAFTCDSDNRMSFFSFLEFPASGNVERKGYAVDFTFGVVEGNVGVFDYVADELRLDIWKPFAKRLINHSVDIVIGELHVSCSRSFVPVPAEFVYDLSRVGSRPEQSVDFSVLALAEVQYVQFQSADNCGHVHNTLGSLLYNLFGSVLSLRTPIPPTSKDGSFLLSQSPKGDRGFPWRQNL